jgi:hypothetical protein
LPADSKKVERLKRTFENAKRYGVKVMNDLQHGVDRESGKLWKDRSNRVAAAAILAQAHAAEERAAKQAPAPTQLAIMVVHGRMRDHGKWEQLAAAEEGRVIDIELPEQELLGPSVADQGVPGQLREDLSQGEAKAQHQETEEGKGG